MTKQGAIAFLSILEMMLDGIKSNKYTAGAASLGRQIVTNSDLLICDGGGDNISCSPCPFYNNSDDFMCTFPLHDLRSEPNVAELVVALTESTVVLRESLVAWNRK